MKLITKALAIVSSDKSIGRAEEAMRRCMLAMIESGDLERRTQRISITCGSAEPGGESGNPALGSLVLGATITRPNIAFASSGYSPVRAITAWVLGQNGGTND